MSHGVGHSVYFCKTMIYLHDIVKDTYTNASGLALYMVLKPLIASDQETVVLSFRDSGITSSSFLNSSFGALIEEFGSEKVMRSIAPRDLSPTQGVLLKKYMASFNGKQSAQ